MAHKNPDEVLEFQKNLELHKTNIPGLVWFDLPVHGDNRGWFKENWQREKMVAAGLPDFQPVQNNMSFNDTVGTTRGIHAEPWDKFVSIGAGRVFGAWVDLREGKNFGKTFTLELDPSKAIFIPRGVGNSYQTLEPDTLYSYLVNDHWSVDGNYSFLNLSDPTVNIQWPISLDTVELSEKDKSHPQLDEVISFKKKKTFVTGGGGQLGRALKEELPYADFVDRSTFNIADPRAWQSVNWDEYDTVINAAAYTDVDSAETPEGALMATEANALALQHLAQTALAHHLTVVHISSDYVFDGSQALHKEDEKFKPLNVYGATKAAGDIIIEAVPHHYIARTTWVVGDGKNFIKTMQNLAERGVRPNVVNDQVGRLTFAPNLAKAIHHLLDTRAPFGTYNVTNDGAPTTWDSIAKATFEQTGHNPENVTGVSTEQYFAGQKAEGKPVAQRPLQSTLDLSKLKETGFTPPDWEQALAEYITHLKQEQNE